jgi:hypothetical protein
MISDRECSGGIGFPESLLRDPWCLPRFGSPGSLIATEEASNSIFQRLLEADHNHMLIFYKIKEGTFTFGQLSLQARDYNNGQSEP